MSFMNADSEWGFFIETPPSFDDSSNSYDYESILRNSEAQDAPEPTVYTTPSGYTRPYDSNCDPVPLQQDEIETRIIMISDLKEEDLNMGNVAELISKKEGIKSMESTSQGIRIEFYDLRDSQLYRSFLSTVIYRNKELNVQFVAPKRNSQASRPANNGTLVLFHLPPELTNHQLSEVFSKYGDIRQIRGTPQKPKQRFIEFWDTRSADRALDEMNGVVLYGNKISIEFSLPGGLRRKALV